MEIRLRRDRLVVTNPGGLYGISVDRLGRDAVTSARNAQPVSICQNARSPECGGRVIEALATGIPTVRSELEAAGLPPPHFVDAGIRFTVVLHQPTTVAKGPGLGRTEQRVYAELVRGPMAAAELAAALDLTEPNVRKALRSLAGKALVAQEGGRGKRGTTYRRT